METDALYNELTGVLEREAELHARLLEEAEGKRAAIVANDVEALAAIEARERDLLDAVSAEEARRHTALDGLRAAGRVTGEAPRLDEVLAAAPAAAAEALGAARTRVREAIEALRERNHRNQRLLEASLEHLRGFFRLVSDAARPSSTYGRDGRRAGGPARLVSRQA